MLRSSYGKPGHSLVWPRIRNVQQISMRSKLGPCRHKKEPEPSMHSGLLSLLPQLKFFWLGGGSVAGTGRYAAALFLALSP